MDVRVAEIGGSAGECGSGADDGLADDGHADDDLVVSRDRAWWDLVRLVVLVIATVVVARMTGRLGDVVGLVLLAATVAVLTAPVRSWLGARLPGGLATALTALATFALVLGVGGLALRGLSDQASRVADDLIERIDDLQPGTLPARVADALDARGGIDEALSRLPAAVVAGEEDTVGVARRVIDTLLVVILAAFFQAAARSGLDRLMSMWPREARASQRDFVGDVVRRGAGYVRRAGLVAAGTWVAVTVAAVALGLPAPLVLGAWAAMWSAVPWVGPWVGGLPFVAVAVSQGWLMTALSAVVAVLLWLAVGAARRRLVEDGRFHLGAATTALAFAVGLSLGGFGGLVVCLTVAALAGAVATSPHRPVRPAAAPALAGADTLLVPTGARIAIAPGWRGALTVLGAATVGALTWMLFGRLGGAVVWVLVGLLVAIALHRPVAWIERRGRVPRYVAIGVVCVVAAGVVAGAVALGVAGGASSSEELSSELPTVVADLEDLPMVGAWLEDHDAALWVSEQMEELPQRLREARDVSEWLPTVGARLLDLFWVLVLGVAFLVDGPRLAAAVERRVPARHRRQASRLAAASHTAVGGYLAGAALVAGINATVVFAIALAVGIALAPVLAVWAFVWNFVPQIGGFMGGFPLVVLALAEGPMRAVVAGLLFVTYQFVENHLIQPAVISEAIDVPAWAALLAALAGGAAAGVVGAVVLTPLVGLVGVVLREVRRPDFPGNTVLVGAVVAEAAPELAPVAAVP